MSARAALVGPGPVCAETPCPVCGGSGLYPVVDRRGIELYAIRCPECHGAGTSCDAPAPVVAAHYFAAPGT